MWLSVLSMYPCILFSCSFVTGYHKCDIYFRKYVSRNAATKGRAVLDGVGLEHETKEMWYSKHPLNEEEAVQSGLIEWMDTRGDSATWAVLLETMEFAKIGVQHISKLKKELQKGAVFCYRHASWIIINMYHQCWSDQCASNVLLPYYTVFEEQHPASSGEGAASDSRIVSRSTKQSVGESCTDSICLRKCHFGKMLTVYIDLKPCPITVLIIGCSPAVHMVGTLLQLCTSRKWWPF